MRNKVKVSSLLASLAAREKKFMGGEFLCPMVRGTPMRVKMDGVVLEMKPDKPFEGWGVFRPTSAKTCKLVRNASMKEKRTYLEALTTFHMIICGKNENDWLGMSAWNETRFHIDGLVPIRLPDEIQLFDVIRAGFDGLNFWFDDIRPEKTPRLMREMLQEEIAGRKVAPINGIGPQRTEAYGIALARELENRKDKNEERIKDALQRAGAQYRSYIDRGETYTVEYIVDGNTHRSTVDKQNLSVVSAGICLNGTDDRFDLQSLISVIKEGDNKSLIVRVGDNRQNED